MPNFSRVLLPTLIATLFLLIAAFGIAKALSQFQNSLKSDPAYHNLAVVSTKDLSEFISMVGSTAQPILEYGLRRIFYFPLFGESERTIKLPSFVSWILLLLLAPWVTFPGLKKNIENKEVVLVLIATATISLWIANLSILAQYASGGRHYEWCALISLLWFSAYNQENYFKSKWFHVLSLVYLNSHFFVWPLVGGAYISAAFNQRKNKTSSDITRFLLCGLFVWSLSVLANWESIRTLVWEPAYRGHMEGQIPTKDLLSVLWLGLDSVRLFRSIFEIKYGVIFLGILGLGFKGNKSFIAFGLFFCSLTVIRSSSALPFNGRYLIPFFGLAWLLVTEATGATLEVFSRIEKAFSVRVTWLRSTAAMVSSLIVFVLVYKASPLATFRAAFEKGIPKENFSDEFFEYEKIKALRDPSIVIGKGAYPYTLTLWYLRDQSKDAPHVRSLSQDVYHINTWKKSWVEFKQKNPSGKTLVHFYTESLCESADPKTFHELKRFSEGCIGEVVAADSVEELEKLFSASNA